MKRTCERCRWWRGDQPCILLMETTLGPDGLCDAWTEPVQPLPFEMDDEEEADATND